LLSADCSPQYCLTLLFGRVWGWPRSVDSTDSVHPPPGPLTSPKSCCPSVLCCPGSQELSQRSGTDFSKQAEAEEKG
ncbi:unnamed protein product, partial [Gulo gulo]